MDPVTGATLTIFLGARLFQALEAKSRVLLKRVRNRN